MFEGKRLGKLAVKKRRKVDSVYRALATIPSFTGLKDLMRITLDNKHSCNQCGKRLMAIGADLGNQTHTCDACDPIL